MNRKLALHDVQVGAAHSARCHIEEHLARTRLGYIALLHAQPTGPDRPLVVQYGGDQTNTATDRSLSRIV
jgi:hypothetical protein